MTGLLKILAFYLFAVLFTNNFSKAQNNNPQSPQPSPPSRSPAVRQLEHFHQRLEKNYQQSYEDTFGQQVVYGSIEAFAAYKLNGYLKPQDKVAIQSIQTQLRALEDRRGVQIYGVDSLTEPERQARINVLKKKLKTIEGNLAQRIGHGTTKIIVRGTQVFLIAQLVSRIYILTALDRRDPGFFPLPSFFCSGFDCDFLINDVIATSNNAYQNSLAQAR